MENDEMLLNLNKELNHIIVKLNELYNLKYNDNIGYLKLGGDMCSIIDIQENVMKSYRDVLIARRILLLNKISNEEKE